MEDFITDLSEAYMFNICRGQSLARLFTCGAQARLSEAKVGKVGFPKTTSRLRCQSGRNDWLRGSKMCGPRDSSCGTLVIFAETPPAFPIISLDIAENFLSSLWTSHKFSFVN